MTRAKNIAARLGLSSCPVSILAVTLVFRDSLPAISLWSLLAGSVAWLALEIRIGTTRPFRGEVPSARWVAASRGLWLAGPWICGLDHVWHLTVATMPGVVMGLAGTVYVAAVILRLCAVVQLGDLFTYDVTATARHQLHTRIVYRYVRHPAYLGLVTLCVVPGVLFESLIGTCFLALTSIPQTIHRAVHEENALLSRFGEAYEEYRRHTGRLLPRWPIGLK